MLLKQLNSSLIKTIIRFTGVSLLLFFFIYEIQLKNLPGLFSSRKVAFIILFVMYFFSKKNFSFTKKTFFAFFVLGLFFYTIVLFFFLGAGDATPLYPKLLFFVLYALCCPHFFSSLFKDIDDFLVAFSFCGFIQSIIVFLQFFSFPFKVFLNNTFANEGNIEFLRLSRATGLGCEGATLGFWLLLSLVACGCLIVRKENKAFLGVFFTILVSQFIVAKTGFILSFFVLLILIYFLMKKSLIKAATYLPFVIFLSILGFYVFIQNVDKNVLTYIQEWQYSAFDMNDGSMYKFNSMRVPDFSTETLIGTGVERGNFSNGYIQHDSGYVKSYVGLGLLMAIAFYLCVYVFMWLDIRQIKSSNVRVWLYFVLAVTAVMEFKEPFILKYLPFFFVYTVSLLSQKQEEPSLLCMSR